MSVSRKVAHELNNADELILDELAEGRNLPQNLANELGYSRQYVQNRLQMLKAADYVENVGGGLYVLVDDPRDEVETDDERDAELERLQERVDELRAELAKARAGEPIDEDELKDAKVFLDRALQELPDDVPGRAAAEDAKRVLEEVLDG